MTQIGITLEANVAEALRKIDSIAASMKNVEEATKKAAKPADKLSEDYKKSAKEAAALERAAKRVYDETRTPAEQHNRRMEELNKLLATGKITVDTYNRAVKSAADQQQATFGPTAVAQIRTYVAGLATGVASLESIKRLMQETRQMADDAGKRVVDDESARRAFRQVSGGDQAQFDRLVAMRDRLREQGMEPAEAGQLIFNAASAGDEFLGDIDLFASLRDINFSSAAGVESVQKLQAAFGGESGAGSSRQIINKILAAAGPSPVQAQDIASAASTATISFSQIGGSDEELLALLGVAAEVTKKPENAASALNSLASDLMRKQGQIRGAEGLEGLELVRALPRLADEGNLLDGSGKPVALEKFLEREAAIGLNIIRELDPKVTRRLADVNAAQAGTGTDQDLLALEIGLEDPDGAAAKLSRQGKQIRDLSEEDRLAELENITDALQDISVSNVGRRGGSAQAVVGNMLSTADRFISPFVPGQDELSIAERQYRIAVQGSGGASEEQIKVLLQIRDRLNALQQEQRSRLATGRDSE